MENGVCLNKKEYDELEGLFVDLHQLLAGWHHDNCWGDWDKEVYDRMISFQKRLAETTGSLYRKGKPEQNQADNGGRGELHDNG